MPPPEPRPAITARAFRRASVVYPGVFRDEYGREMSLVFADRYRDAGGATDRVRFWLEASPAS